MPALVREIKEEIGIDIDMEQTHFVHTMYRAAHDVTGDRADYFWMTEHWNSVPLVCEPHKCKEFKWFSMDDLPENTIRTYAKSSRRCVVAFRTLNLTKNIRCRVRRATKQRCKDVL